MARARTPHTATHRFHKVKVVLRSGEVFIGRFLDRKSNYVIFKERTVRKGDIKSFVPFHADNHGKHRPQSSKSL